MKKQAEQRYASWTEFALEISRVGQLFMPAGSIPDSEKYVALKKGAMLATLADSELWELARAGKWTRVPKGRAIVAEGAKGTSVFFLAQGEAQVTQAKRLLNMVSAGECFGEMAYIAGCAKGHATVDSLTDLLLS